MSKYNKTVIVTLLTMTIIVLSGVFFNSCQKEETLITKTENDLSVKQQKDLYGIWHPWDNVENAIGSGGLTGEVTITGDKICSRTEQFRLWNDQLNRYTHLETHYILYNCSTGKEILRTTVREKLISSILILPTDWGIDDYMNIDNFEFYVNDQFVTDGFNYVNPIEFADDDGTIIVGKIQITYENVSNLFYKIHEHGNWLE